MEQVSHSQIDILGHFSNEVLVFPQEKKKSINMMIAKINIHLKWLQYYLNALQTFTEHKLHNYLQINYTLDLLLGI